MRRRSLGYGVYGNDAVSQALTTAAQLTAAGQQVYNSVTGQPVPNTAVNPALVTTSKSSSGLMMGILAVAALGVVGFLVFKKK